MKQTILCSLAGGLSACVLSACHHPPEPAPGPDPAPVPEQPPRSVIIDKELMITDLSVVNAPPATEPGGAWTFGRLFRDLGPSDGSGKERLLSWLRSWERDQNINNDVATARPSVRQLIIDPWKARDNQAGTSDEGWNVNWDHAPFRLLAIVNRIDLRRVENGQTRNAGEGRFVFCLIDAGSAPGVFDPRGEPLPFTVIFEYELLASSGAEVLGWARRWHALGGEEFGPGFVDALKRVTDGFAGRGVAAHLLRKPGGTALNQLRTNEIPLRFPIWELREFVPQGSEGLLMPVTVKRSPRNSLDHTEALGDFIRTKAAQLTSPGGFVLDADPQGSTMVGASSLIPPPQNGQPFAWSAPDLGPQLNEARHALAFQTCNGCHHAETGVDTEFGSRVGGGFVHIAPRAHDEAAALSGFLTGISVPDPIFGGDPASGGRLRRFEDLESRARGPDGLEALLGIRSPAAAAATTAITAPSQETRRVRVH